MYYYLWKTLCTGILKKHLKKCMFLGVMLDLQAGWGTVSTLQKCLPHTNFIVCFVWKTPIQLPYPYPLAKKNIKTVSWVSKFWWKARSRLLERAGHRLKDKVASHQKWIRSSFQLPDRHTSVSFSISIKIHPYIQWKGLIVSIDIYKWEKHIL